MLLENPSHTHFFSACHSLFGIVGFAGNFRQVNPAWKKVLGYTTQEIYKSLYIDLVHPKDKEKTEGLLEQLATPGHLNFINFTNRFLHHNGGYREMMWEITRADTEPAFFLVGMEITAYHAQMQETLQLAKEDFEFIMESKREGVLDWNLQTQQVHYSPRWRGIVGHTQQELGHQVEAWYTLIHPNDHHKVVQEVQRCLREKDYPVYEKTHRIRHKEGQYRWVHSQGTVLRDEQGQAYRFLISFIDITERKRMEDALYISEKYAKLFFFQGEATLLVNIEGKIFDLNPAACRLYGYTREELLNSKQPEIFTELTSLKTVEGQKFLKTKHKRKGGQLFPVDLIASAWEWQNRKLYILTIRDTSSTQELIQSLTDREQQYQTFLNNLPEALTIWNLTTQKPIFVNQTARELYGYSPQEWQTCQPEYLGIDLQQLKLLTLHQSQYLLPNLEWQTAKDNTAFPVEIALSRYPIQQEDHLCILVRAAYDRHKQEQDLHQLQGLYDQFLQIAPAFFMVLSADNKIIFLNNTLLNELGYDLIEVLDQDYLMLLVPSSDHPFITDILETTLNTNQQVLAESTLKTKQHTLLAVEWHYLASHHHTQTFIVAIGIDLNLRKHSHQQLRLYRKIIETAWEALVIRRADGKLIYCNPAYESLFKTDQSHFYEHVTPKTNLVFTQEIMPLLQAGKSWEGILEVIDVNGRQFPTWQRFAAVCNEQRQLLFFYVMLHDISHEQSLREQCQQYELLFHSLPLAVAYQDKNGYIVKANSNLTHCLIKENQDLIGLPLEQFLPKEIIEWFSQENALILQTGQAKLGILHPLGKNYFKTNKIPYYNLQGESLGILLISQNVNEQIQLEQRIRSEYQQYELIFEWAPVAIIYKDPQDRILRINRAAAQLCQQVAEELTGQVFSKVMPVEVKKYHADDLEILTTDQAQLGLIAEYQEGRYWQVDKIPGQHAQGQILLIFATEITEQVQARRELIYEKQQYENILHHAPLAIWCKDRRDRLLYVNQYLADLWDTVPEKLQGLAFHDLDSDSEYQHSDAKVMNTGEAELGIIEDYFQVEWLVYKIPYRKSEQIVGLIVYALDISDQRSTEFQLRRELEIAQRNERVLQIGIDSLPVMVYATDHEGQIVVWNRKCEQVTGYSSHEIIGNSEAWELLYPETEYREQVLSMNLLKHHENLQHWEWQLFCKNGLQKTVAWSMISQGNGGDFSAEIESAAVDLESPWEWSIGEDVTEREQILQSIQENEMRLRLAIENLPMMICALDEDGHFVLWNQECEQITGFNKLEIIGNPKAWELLYPDREYREQLLETQRDMLQQYGGIRQWELKLQCKEGVWKTVSWSVSNQVNMGGFAIWWIGQDMTEQEQVLEQLCDSEERLGSLLQSMPVMVKAYDEQGTLLVWNRCCEQVTGYQAGELRNWEGESALLYQSQCDMGGSDWVACDLGLSCLTSYFLKRKFALRTKEGGVKMVMWSNVSSEYPISGWYSWWIGEEVEVAEL